MEYTASAIKKIESILKTGKEPELPKELFPEIDRNGPPIIINAVDTASLTPTEQAYYFASTTARTAVSDQKANSAIKKGIESQTISEEIKQPITKPKNYPPLPSKQPKEEKKGKRRKPEYNDKSAEYEGEEENDERNDAKNKGNEDNDYELCPICKVNYEGANKNMIGCDGRCKGWYHIDCVGLSASEFEKLSKDENSHWECPYCIKGVAPPAYGRNNGKYANVTDGRKRKKIGK